MAAPPLIMAGVHDRRSETAATVVAAVSVCRNVIFRVVRIFVAVLFTGIPVLPPTMKRGVPGMLYYAVVFLVIALIAGVLGFGGIAGASAGIAQILFFVFLALLVISLLFGWSRRV
jgi:uncharacterized membrane protein YtjA (UPF0391 family)